VIGGKKIDGFKAALEMLQHLDLVNQQSILADIARKDPEMAIKLKSQLVTFDDLQFLTQSMMGKLWQKTMLQDWGLALRGSSGEVKNHVLSLLSKNNRADLEELLTGRPQALSDVMQAQGRIMEVVMEMKDAGEIVLSKDKSEKYV
jgi:flagellar motor switch protein FliG